MSSLNDLLKQYNLNDSLLESISNDIIEEFASLIVSVEKPKTIILGAQPGSGKTELEKIAIKQFDNNAVICNVDNFKEFHPYAADIKKNHPELFSEITSPFAHKWNLSLKNFCIEQKLNFILETTFNNGSNINKIINNLKFKNYSVDIFMLSVPSIFSKIGIILRYEQSLLLFGGGRKVLPKDHDERFLMIPDALLEVEKHAKFDSIYLFGRSELNYNLNSSTGIYLLCESKKSVFNDFMIERSQEFLPKAEKYIENQIVLVENLMNRRNASKEEINNFYESLVQNEPEIKKGNKI